MYTTLLVLVLTAGLVPGSAYLVTHRVARWRDPVALDASGWVAIITLLYAWSLYRVLIGRHDAAVTDDRVIGLAIGVGIDVLVWLRLVNWLAFYRRRNRKR